MEDSAAFNQITSDLLFLQHDIRSWIAVKGKISVAVFLFQNKCQRCMHLIIKTQTGSINPLFLDGSFQHVPETVITDLADKSSRLSKTSQHGKHIAWCPTRICFQKRISLL